MKNLALLGLLAVIICGGRAQLHPENWSFAAMHTGSIDKLLFTTDKIYSAWDIYDQHLPTSGLSQATFTLTRSKAYAASGTIKDKIYLREYKIYLKLKVQYLGLHLTYQQTFKLNSRLA